MLPRQNRSNCPLRHATMKISFQIDHDLAAIVTLSEQLQILEQQWSLSRKTIAEITLILDELITNTILHGDCDKKQPIDISLTKTGQTLIIQIIDAGLRFDPTLCTIPDTSLPLEQRKCGGLGILLVRQFCDYWHYTRQSDKNILTLQKKLS